MLLYFLIFFSKIIENTLSTLRIIVIANGKKKLGAILQGLVALVWIFVTGVVIININKDPLKILFFCLGTTIGSYMGSLIEEKIALGENTLICIIQKKYIKIINKLKLNIKIVSEKNNYYSIVFINIKRKDKNKISKLIKKIDNNSIIIFKNAKNVV